LRVQVWKVIATFIVEMSVVILGSLYQELIFRMARADVAN
jgi:hypothetical protein